MKNPKGKIGIGIITHNRPEVFQASLRKIKATLPKGAKLVIVDDASAEPVAEATFRFEKNAGIAAAKNKCIELLDGCEHIFLFDDDCYPRRKGWELPYIASPEPHLMYLFLHLRHHKLNDARLVYEDAQHYVISHPRGCMLYLHRSAIDAAGGMDTRYDRWGFEHGDLSNRIYNLGLTSFRYMDVAGSENLIYSLDQEQQCETTVRGNERARYLVRNKAKYEASFTSTEYWPYKEGAKRKMPKAKASKEVVITSFFNALLDTQRGRRWAADYSKLDALRKSVGKHGRKLVIISNCFKSRKSNEKVENVLMPQGANPYFQRWLSQWQYLRDNPDISRVFLVDATDVEMLHDPFPKMKKGRLYVGDEPLAKKVGCPWMKLTSRNAEIKGFVDGNNATLLNCGVVGGSREDVMRLCRMLYSQYFEKYQSEKAEMPLFNFILHTQWPGKVEYGRHVTTVFKKQERTAAWFKHK